MSTATATGVRHGLVGSTAFRGLGRAATDDGRSVARGRLFRADAMSALDDADRAVIDALGLRLVCDLRSRDERERTRCLHWLRPAPRVMHLELSSGLATAATPSIERLLHGPDPDAAASLMRTTYAALPGAAAPLLAGLLQALAAGELPALVHCTAGKDRTGFTIAMILSALGVQREIIYDDYLRGSGRDPLVADQPSSRLIEWILRRALEPEEAILVHGVHREYLDAAFASIERDWGSTLQYLERAVGIDMRCRSALMDKLLVQDLQ